MPCSKKPAFLWSRFSRVLLAAVLTVCLALTSACSAKTNETADPEQTVELFSEETVSAAASVVTRTRYQNEAAYGAAASYSSLSPLARDAETSEALLSLLAGEWTYLRSETYYYSEIQLTLLDADSTELTSVELLHGTNEDGISITYLYQGSGNLYVPAEGELLWSEVARFAGVRYLYLPEEEAALVETILLDGEPWADGLLSAPQLVAAHDGQALLQSLFGGATWTYDQTVAPASLEETLTFTMLDADGEPLRTLTLTHVPGADGEEAVCLVNDVGDLYSRDNDAFTDWDDLMQELGLSETE